MQTNNMPVPVMILGCGRSGTSIFGELFEGLPPYTYHSEPWFYTVMNLDFTKPQAIKVPRESKGFLPTPGLSFPLKTLLEKVPTLKMFWIVRHPLDTICSLRIGISKNWGHHPKPPDWQNWLSRPLLLRCAYHWTYLNSVGFQQVSSLVTLVRFEDMLANPSAFAKQTCLEVGMSSTVYTFEISQWANRVQNTNNKHFVEAKTSRTYSRPDHTVRVERWKENLSAKEVQSILPIISETAQKFGYTLGTLS